MYVNDVIASAENTNQAIRVATTIPKIFKEMGKTAITFWSNSFKVLVTIQLDDIPPTMPKYLLSTNVPTDIVSKMADPYEPIWQDTFIKYNSFIDEFKLYVVNRPLKPLI